MRILIALFGTLLVGSLAAQNNTHAVFMSNAPQTIFINPATPMEHKLWIGIPALTNIQVSALSTGVSVNDLLGKEYTLQETIDNLVSSVEPGDRFELNQRLDIFNFGFSVGKGFLAFGLSQQLYFNLEYPAELFKYLREGNAQYLGTTVDVGGFASNAQVINDLSLTYQYPITEKLTVGSTFHLMTGLANYEVVRSSAKVYTDVTETQMETDILIHYSSIYNEDENDFRLNGSNFFLGQNKGFSFDIGAHYRVSDKLSVGASFMGLGSITWDANVTTYKSNANIIWEGVEYTYQQDQDISFNDYLDTLAEKLDFQEIEGGSYRTTPVQRIILSGQYHLDSTHSFGLAYEGVIVPGSYYNNIGVTYIGRYSRWFHLMAGYNITSNTYSNISLGGILNLGAFQLTLITDNALGIAQFPDTYFTSIRLGMNLCFGERPHTKNQ